MNSLQDLNDGFDVIEFADPRTANVLFGSSTGNGTQNVQEGQSYPLYVAIDITDIINYQDCAVTYRVDVSPIAGATVSWPTLPGYMSIANTTPGVYVVSGFRSAADWSVARQPTVNLPDVIFGTYTVTATINYLNTSIGWNITTNIQNIAEWTAPTTFWFSTGSNLIAGVPNLSAANTSNWAITVTPSVGSYVTSLSTNGTGGISIWNNTTKVLTIEGTNNQINSHLNSLTMITNGEINDHMTFAYLATAYSNGATDLVTQAVRSSVIRYLGTVSAFTYNEDTPVIITGAPQITDVETVGGGYFVQIVPNVTSYVSSLSSTSALGGTSTFNNSTKRLSIVGTKAQVNDHLTKITMTPGSDVAIEFTLSYTVTNPLGAVQTKAQPVNIGAQHDEVSNITLTRTYTSVAANPIFGTNTPVITDLDTTNPQYTISLTVPTGVGTFSAPGTTTSRTWTYTGTRSQVNVLFANITFTPASGYFLDNTITYSQTKTISGGSTVQQLTNQEITLLGPRVAFNTATPVNQNVTTSEGGQHSVPVGINIVNVSNFSTTLPVYTIDLTSVPGSTVTWTTIPAGCSVTNPSPDIYRINGISSSTIWNQIRSPLITLNNYSNGSIPYTATVSWSGPYPGSTSWTVNMNITDVAPFSGVSTFTYSMNGSNVLTGQPTLVDSGSQSPTWTVQVTCSRPSLISNMTTLGSGGTVSYTNNMLSIQGTVSEVNSHLSTIRLAVNNLNLTAKLIYNAANTTTNETGFIEQNLINTQTFLLNQTRSNTTLASGTVEKLITGGPLINDSNLNQEGYTLNVKTFPLDAVSNIRLDVPTAYSIAFNPSSYIGDSNITSSQVLGVSNNGQMIFVRDNYSSGAKTVTSYQLVNNVWQLRGSVGQAAAPSTWGSNGQMSDSGNRWFAEGFTYNIGNTSGYFPALSNVSTPHLSLSGEFLFGSNGTSLLIYSAATSATAWTQQSSINTNMVIADVSSNYDGSIRVVTSTAANQTKVYLNNTLTATIQFGSNRVVMNNAGDLICIGNSVWKRISGVWYSVFVGLDGVPTVHSDDTITTRTIRGTLITYLYSNDTYIKFNEVAEWQDGFVVRSNSGLWGARHFSIGIAKYVDIVSAQGLAWNQPAKTFTFTGLKDSINSIIDSLKITGNQNFTGNFEIDYQVIAPNSTESTRNQFVTRI